MPSKNRWTTPHLLRTLLGAAWACAFLLFLVVALATAQRQAAFQTVGHDSAPSIIAAQHVRAYLADMDANAANELIVTPGQNMAAVRDFDNRRREVTDSLITSAQNITFGDRERVPVVTLADGLADYERAITQARDLHGRSDPAMLEAYRRADDILHKTLLPAVDTLDKVNDDALNDAAGRAAATFTATLLLTILAGLLLLAVLIAAQLFLTRRTHRALNPGLLVATIVTGLYLLHTVITFAAVGSRFRAAKSDAFDSVRALWHARAVAYDANADESRWLQDRSLAAAYEKQFRDKSAQIAALPMSGTYGSVAEAYANGHKEPAFKGFLADELNNITFPGELDAAVGTLRAWGQYIAIDDKIRQLENSGAHDKAIAVCVGNNPGESNWAYTQFDNALAQTLDINQKEFDEDVQAGTNLLKPYRWLNPFVLLLVGGLAFAGMLPRLREYAF